MMRHMKRQVVGALTTLMVLVSSTVMGGQVCLSLDPITYNGPEESRYLETGVSQMVENGLREAGVVLAEMCDGRSLAIRVTLFGGTANIGAAIDTMGYHFSRSGAESELIGFVERLTADVAGLMMTGATPPPAPVLSTTGETPGGDPALSVVRSEVFPLDIKGVAVGDVTGDGGMEAVAVSSGTLQLLSVSKKEIVEVSRIAFPRYMRPVRLDVVDLDGVGGVEVILSATHAANQSPLVMVYRYDGTTLVPVGKVAHFLTAVVSLPDGTGRVCIGQKIDGIDYWGDIHRVRLGERGLEMGETLDMSSAFHVLGWDFAPVAEGPEKGFFRLSDTGRLEFWSDAKVSLYRGDESYGGSRTYLSKEEGSKQREERRYLVSRVQAVNGASLKGVGVLQAENSMGSLFQGLRRYKSGRVVVVAWNGYELKVMAATPSFKGFVSDFSVVDVDGDGRQEAFCSVLSAKGGFSGKARSYFAISSLE